MDIENFPIYFSLWDREKALKEENENLKKEIEELKRKLIDIA